MTSVAWPTRSSPYPVVSGYLPAGIDAAPFLLLYVFLLFAIPSSQVFSALGGSGSPATLYGACLLGLWALMKASRSPHVGFGFSPIHLAWLGVAIAGVASYFAAATGPIGGPELRGADRGLLALASSSGVLLLMADGLLTRKRLELVLKGLSIGLIFNAAISMSQYFLQRNWYGELPFPALSPAWAAGMDARSGLLRTSGTAVHAIEYGVVETMGLALTLHWALFARSTRARAGWTAGVCLIMATIPLSVARSPMVGLVVVLLMLLPTWPWRWRIRALLATPFVLVAMRAAFPGVLGTVLALFTWINEDPSTTGRTSDYGEVSTLLAGHVWFGRGIGTLIPQIYITLDNQYLSSILDTGVVGLVASVALLGTAVVWGFVVRSRFHDRETKDLVHSLTTGVVVAVVVWSFFDGFAFRQATGTLLILIGAIASLSRIQQTEVRSDDPPTGTSRRRHVRIALPALLGGAAVAVLVLGLAVMRGQQPAEYQTTAHLLIQPSDPQLDLQSGEASRMAAILNEVMRSPQIREAVREQGGTGRFRVAQGEGSLAPASDVLGSGPSMRILAVSEDESEAVATLEVATTVLQEWLVDAQVEAGSPESQLLVATEIIPAQGPWPMRGAPSRALLAALILAPLCGLLAFMLLSRRTDSYLPRDRGRGTRRRRNLVPALRARQ